MSRIWSRLYKNLVQLVIAALVLAPLSTPAYAIGPDDPAAVQADTPAANASALSFSISRDQHTMSCRKSSLGSWVQRQPTRCLRTLWMLALIQVLPYRSTGPPDYVSVIVEPDTIFADGETQATVLVYITDVDGRAVADGTVVSLETTAGRLSAGEARTREGLARLILLAPRQPGEAMVTVYAGGRTGSATVQFVARSGVRLSPSRARSLPNPAESVERVRSPLRPDDRGGWKATNARQQAAFDAAGFEFVSGDPDERTVTSVPSLAFKLETVRVDAHVFYSSARELDVSPAIDGSRAIYRRGEIVEESYRAWSTALQQVFTLHRPPSVRGDLVLEGEFLTTLLPKLVSDRDGILFYLPEERDRSRDTAVLAYSGALVVDGAGREIVAGLRLEGHRPAIVVPGRWLAEATYPVVIDPMIGDPTMASDPRPQQQEPAVAYNPDDGEYLVVWCGYATGGASCDLQAQRVLTDGTLVGSVITVALGAEDQTDPAVVYNSDDDEYVIVWQDFRNDDDGDIYGQRLSSVGALLDNADTQEDESLAGVSTVIAALAPEEGDPQLAYNSDAGTYLVVWEIHIGNYDVYGQIISATGALSGTSFVVQDSNVSHCDPVVDYSSQNDEFLVVWRRDWEDIYGQRVSTTGEPLDNVGTPEDESQSDVAFAVCDASEEQADPHIAANPKDGTFLVVWSDERVRCEKQV